MLKDLFLPLTSPQPASTLSLGLALLVLLLVVLERLAELRLSRRNARRVLSRGGVEIGRAHYPAMVLLHTGFLVAVPLEWWFARPPWVPLLFAVSVSALAASMALRYWAIATLGDRWNTRVLCEPGKPLVDTGPYRWLRHPNYVAVVAEFLSLPLLHGGWRVALAGSLLNGIVLWVRLRCENHALRDFPLRETSSPPTSVS